MPLLLRRRLDTGRGGVPVETHRYRVVLEFIAVVGVQRDHHLAQQFLRTLRGGIFQHAVQFPPAEFRRPADGVNAHVVGSTPPRVYGSVRFAGTHTIISRLSTSVGGAG